MENFNIITIEQISKYGQHYIEANISLLENVVMTSRLIKTKDIEDIRLLSDFNFEDHVEDEIESINTTIKENLYNYFYLKMNKQYECYKSTNKSNLLLVKGDYRIFMKLIPTGGNF